MNRRALLGSLGAVGASGLAGCLDAVPFLGSGTKLARLAVVNWDDQSHTVDVLVERDGSVVHDSTYTVDGMDGNEAQAGIAECTWDDTSGEYVVSVRLADGGVWREFNLLDAADGSPDCVIATVQYGRLSGIDEDRPLNIEIRDRCDEVSENYEGGCPAYTSNSSHRD